MRTPTLLLVNAVGLLTLLNVYMYLKYQEHFEKWNTSIRSHLGKASRYLRHPVDDRQPVHNPGNATQLGSTVQPVRNLGSATQLGNIVQPIRNLGSATQLGNIVQPIRNLGGVTQLGSTVQPVRNLGSATQLGSTVQPVRNLGSATQLGSSVQPIRNLGSARQLGSIVQPIRNLGTARQLGSTVQPVRNPGNARQVGSSVQPIRNLGTARQLGRIVQPIRNPGNATQLGRILQPVRRPGNTTQAINYPVKAKPANYKGNITIRFLYRLGNHLSHYAALFTLAKTYNLRAIVDDGVDLQRIFTLGEGVHFSKTRLNYTSATIKYGERKPCAYDTRLETFNFTGKYVELIGSYQSWRYFYKYKDDIRRHFTFQQHIKDSVVKLLWKHGFRIHDRSITLVGIHVRRGDKLRGSEPIATAIYFENAMNYFRQRVRNPRFLVCSDEMSWCKVNIRAKNDDVLFMEGNPPEIDFAILSHCDHLIMSIGTFGWWAGWLARGTVIYYKFPENPAHVIYNWYNVTDYYRPEWIAME